MVETFATRRLLDVGELGRAVFKDDACLQTLDHLVIDLATHTYRVFTVHLVGRMHQTVGQLTISGKHQQTGGVDVQTTDVDPATFLRARHLVEHGRTAFRVVTGADFAVGFVVHDHAADRLGGLFALDHLAINGDGVMQVDAQTEGGVFAIDLDAAVADPGFYITARADADTGEDFLQFFACGADFLIVFRAVFLVFDTHLGTSRCGLFRRP
ncbi:hypothetical protein PS645_05302 [Pseudomonas fluorescens]|uniref:Uncharacterized protein n=1 Tax=Pseudomonas fluorescens TaxID=294 RepID=A0A5E6XDZ2_PSEFL|nr:hypothetical protein PS645_05302 [Pseudomonas fluorescens]